MMKWPAMDALPALIPMPEGYHLEGLGRTHVPALIAAIREWHPEISVGVGAGFLREEFYRDRVCLDGDLDKDVWAVRIMFGNDMVGILSIEREVDSLALYGRVLAVAPAHRGTKISVHSMEGYENIGRAMGAAFIYGLATLKHPYMQRALERAGFRLLGFLPGYDRSEVSPGVVKRVYQSIYAKLLVPGDEVHWPDTKGMTPEAKRIYELMFADRPR